MEVPEDADMEALFEMEDENGDGTVSWYCLYATIRLGAYMICHQDGVWRSKGRQRSNVGSR